MKAWMAVVVLGSALAVAQTAPAPAAQAKEQPKKMDCCDGSGCCGSKDKKDSKDAKDDKGGCCAKMGEKEGSMCARPKLKDGEKKEEPKK